MWKHIVGRVFASRDVILGVVGELGSCRDFCHRAWTVTQPLVSSSLYSSPKKAENEKDIVWTGQGCQGLSRTLQSGQCYQQPHWRQTTTALNSSGEELRLHPTPPKCAANLTVKQTSKPRKGKQHAALAQRACLVKGTLNAFGSFYYCSNLQFSSHIASVPK